jgi:cobalamin biosynthesis Mg chelatase CobN
MPKILTALLTLLAALALAGSAQASGRDVIDDCTDDEVLTKTYTQKEYRDALAKLPADADQYGNCRDVIARAQDAAATKGASKGSSNNKTDATTGATASAGGTPGGPGPSTAPAKDQLAAASADDRAAVQEAAKTPVDAAAGNAAVAERVGTAPGASVSDLPVPILVLLALLLAGALALAAVRIRSLVHTRRA